MKKNRSENKVVLIIFLNITGYDTIRIVEDQRNLLPD